MRRADRALLTIAVLALLCASSTAHDGGFGHSRRSIFVDAGAGELTIEYRVFQNRDEALIELTRMDRDGDGQVSATERDVYFTARGRRLAEGLQVRTADGAALPVRFVRQELHQTLVQCYHLVVATDAA